MLALSSAGGKAPFDAALRRYVEFLTADGALEVDLEIDRASRLARTSRSRSSGSSRRGSRTYAGTRGTTRSSGSGIARTPARPVADDGAGFEEPGGAGQGLRNIRMRAASIAAASVNSLPGRGAAVEVALRT